MTRNNILTSFERIKIWPFNFKAMENKMGLHTIFSSMENFDSNLNTTFDDKGNPPHVNTFEVHEVE
jgi:hypothetical protein